MGYNPNIDRDLYESSRHYLRAALKEMAEAGHQLHDFSDYVLEKFGDDFLPYLEQFYCDIREGRVHLNELSHSAREAFFGYHISAAERDRRIRETAYLHAEQRGFVGGSDIDDWLYAEKQVDAQLATEAGLVAKGRKSISSIASAMEKELVDIGESIAKWIKKNLAPASKVKTKKATARTTVKKKAPAKKAASPAATSVKKKAAIKKKAAAKKAVKKKTVKKKAAKKK